MAKGKSKGDKSKGGDMPMKGGGKGGGSKGGGGKSGGKGCK